MDFPLLYFRLKVVPFVDPDAVQSLTVTERRTKVEEMSWWARFVIPALLRNKFSSCRGVSSDISEYLGGNAPSLLNKS